MKKITDNKLATARIRRIHAIKHPSIRPIFFCRPDRVSGMPIFRESFPLAAESPIARFHENEKPNFLAI
jgi:hypothetical protein